MTANNAIKTLSTKLTVSIALAYILVNLSLVNKEVGR